MIRPSTYQQLEQLVADVIDAGDPTLCERAQSALELVLAAHADHEIA